MTSKRTERALEQVLREVRADAPPELDFAAMEARLPRGPVPGLAAPGGRRSSLLLAAAALVLLASGAALRFWPAEQPAPVAERRVEEEALGAVNGDSLEPGAEVTTRAEGRSIEHPLRATWTLSANSRATLVERGEVVRVRLESGSLRARIVPSTLPETFVVEAADVRVAVHGTVFSVSLGKEGVAVDVEEGTVLVGPRATPGVGQLLASPTSARFTLLGKPVEKRRAGRPSPASRTMNPAAEVPLAAPAEVVMAPERPTSEEFEKATGAVVDLASSCFRQRTSAGDGVRVTAHTELSFRAEPSGTISSVRFEPPIAPNVQACIDEGAARLRTVKTARGFESSRSVDLER